MKRNLTMTIDGDTLDRARVVAAKRRRTLTALIREYLEHLAREDREKESALRRLRKLMRAKPLEVGPVRWTRDELHGR